MNIKKYSEFKVEYVKESSINEGIFDTLKTIFSKLTSIFSDSEKINRQVDAASARKEFQSLSSKEIKAGTTYIAKLQDPKDESMKILLSFTKLADLPDKSGIFQISGTDNTKFLSAMKIRSVQELNKVGVLAIISEFKLNEPLEMRVYKGINQNGENTITESLIKTVLIAEDIIKERVE